MRNVSDGAIEQLEFVIGELGAGRAESKARGEHLCELLRHLLTRICGTCERIRYLVRPINLR